MCLIVVFTTNRTNDDCLCFVGICDFGEDRITFCDQFTADVHVGMSQVFLQSDVT